MTETTAGKVNRRVFYAIGAWVALIFVTSSFVVPFNTFVRFVQELSGDNAFKQWFAQFWLAGWFFIVKGWHATEYAILVFLSAAALQRLTNWSRAKRITAAFVFAVLFAASDEWHQTFVPGRDGCARDVLIDSAGAALAALFLFTRRSARISQAFNITDVIS